MRKLKKQHIAVIGLGQFGHQMARELAKSAEVIAIDREKDLVEAIANDVQRALCMDASNYDNLKSVITPDFDEAIVSMGEAMEASALCTLHLKQIGVSSIRAKAINEDHATILTAIGATQIIFPERETARRMAQSIINPNLLDFIPIEDEYRVCEISTPESFIGSSLIELDLRKRFSVFAIAVKQYTNDKFVFLPDANYQIRIGDILVLIGKEDDLLKISKQD